MLMQQVKAQFLRPPVADGGANACGGIERAFGFGLYIAHVELLFFIMKQESKGNHKFVASQPKN